MSVNIHRRHIPQPNTSLTVVTGIWDIGRDNAGRGFKRNFSHYLDHFGELLCTDNAMVVFVDPVHVPWVLSIRGERPTHCIAFPSELFKTKFPWYEAVQEIRMNPDWRRQADWLPYSPQATLPLYNPLVMSKMFLLGRVAQLNPFNSTHVLWLDGGLTHTVSPHLLKSHVLSRFVPNLDRMHFVCFPYKASREIHGFSKEGMDRLANTNVDRVARGGVFGGSRDVIELSTQRYRSLLDESFRQGYMGTEENILTLMTYRFPDSCQFEVTGSDGRLGPLFERFHRL